MYNTRKTANYHKIHTSVYKPFKQVKKIAPHNLFASLSFSIVFNAI
jgi:hypothetical protein